ncbi:MAG: dUTP diphosphatase [Desulfobacterota bacterium]|nr:dUTP diphosphatase [Thermodesulfobacteriota bacterium]
MKTVTIALQRLFPDRDRDLPLPGTMTAGASGLDLPAAVAGEITLAPGEIRLIPTGLVMAIPEGYEGQIRPRSGLALKHGISLINSPGTIDSDYRGEIGLPLINLGPAPYTIRRGDRVAQLVIQEVCRVELRLTSDLEATVRGGGGFGHSGV